MPKLNQEQGTALQVIFDAIQENGIEAVADSLRETITKHPTELLEELLAETAECPECVVAIAWDAETDRERYGSIDNKVGTHRFKMHGVDRRASSEDESGLEPPERKTPEKRGKKNGEKPEGEPGNGETSVTKRRTSRWFDGPAESSTEDSAVRPAS